MCVSVAIVDRYTSIFEKKGRAEVATIGCDLNSYAANVRVHETALCNMVADVVRVRIDSSFFLFCFVFFALSCLTHTRSVSLAQTVCF